jgi:hypothetical protein
VGEDRLLECLQLRPRLEAELRDKRLARRRIGVESLRLPTGAVEGHHELSTQPLAQRERLDERGDLPDELRVSAAAEIGVDPGLERRGPLVLERGRGVPCERLVLEIGER